jgi:hypothetical protein
MTLIRIAHSPVPRLTLLAALLTAGLASGRDAQAADTKFDQAKVSITLRTGTSEGDCLERELRTGGKEHECRDGEFRVLADTVRGCLEVWGRAQCLIGQPVPDESTAFSVHCPGPKGDVHTLTIGSQNPASRRTCRAELNREGTVEGATCTETDEGQIIGFSHMTCECNEGMGCCMETRGNGDCYQQ